MASHTLRLATFALTLAATALLATACDPIAAKDTEKVTISAKTFTLKLATDDAARAKGLSGVKELPEDGGMLFVFPDSKPLGFWMIDCVMDIDVAFIDPLGIVTAVHTMPKEEPRKEGETDAAYKARLKHYYSGVPAQFAIELQPGAFGKLGIKRGSKIDLDLPKLKALAK